MVRSTRTSAAASSASTFDFTEEHDIFIVLYTTIMQVDRNTLTTIFNRNFGLSVSQETITRRANELATRTYSYQQ